jgi:hypothetical protein
LFRRDRAQTLAYGDGGLKNEETAAKGEKQQWRN